MESASSLLIFRSPSPFRIAETDLPISTPYGLGPTLPTVGFAYPPASPHPSNDKEVVQESSPVVHRLRLSSSA